MEGPRPYLRRKCLQFARLVFSLVLALALAEQATPSAPAKAATSTPLFDNLGTLHHPITTSDLQAQRLFDQGLRLVYAFNHEEAIRSFEEATHLDPTAAMAYWGIGLALGPNINAPMDPEEEGHAYAMVLQARGHARTITQRERAYIEALAVRYSLSPDADRKTLDRAYAEAMRKVVQQYPEDLDVATLFAEALMDLHPWDFWTKDGRPQPGTLEIVSTLEQILRRNPEHMGACHYYIHVVEASPHPARALPCAQRLPSLAPGAGHLVHMPAHIYMRLGLYEKAAERNAQAASVDRHYLEGSHLSGLYPIVYYPHTLHFLAAALVMQGRSGEAIKAARDLVGVVPMEAVRQRPSTESFTSTPLFVLVRFGMWQDILREPPPPSDLYYTRGIWHYARGLAFAAQRQLDQAEKERHRLHAIAKSIPADRRIGFNSAETLLQIARQILDGALAARRGGTEDAIGHLRQAVRLQDLLNYNEPPDWSYPVRQSLGSLLLRVRRAAEAETVFREDLERNPENPWSLHGLGQSLHAQNGDMAATRVKERFRRAWSHADLDFDPSRFEAFLATSLNRSTAFWVG